MNVIRREQPASAIRTRLTHLRSPCSGGPERDCWWSRREIPLRRMCYCYAPARIGATSSPCSKAKGINDVRTC